jgi:hypothetical protein
MLPVRAVRPTNSSLSVRTAEGGGEGASAKADCVAQGYTDKPYYPRAVCRGKRVIRA